MDFVRRADCKSWRPPVNFWGPGDRSSGAGRRFEAAHARSKILLTFDDPDIEASYLTPPHGAPRLPAVRILALMGMSVLVVYILVNPAFLDAVSVIHFTISALIFIAVMGFYYYIVGTAFYPTVRSIDFCLFLSLHMIQTSMNFSQFIESRSLHLTPLAIIDINTSVLMFFGAAAFAGSIFWFALWAGSALVICSAISLYLGDFTLQSVYGLLPVGTAYVLSIFLNWTIENKNREIYMLNLELDERRRMAAP